MQPTLEWVGDVAVVTLQDRQLDSRNAEEFREQLLPILESCPRVVLDFGPIRFVDSRERDDSSAVHYTPFSCVLLHYCGCSHAYGNAWSNPLLIEVPRVYPCAIQSDGLSMDSL